MMAGDDARRVLEALMWYGGQTRQTLTRMARLSRARLADVLDTLSAAGWLLQQEIIPSTGGRRAERLDLDPGAGTFSGIAIEDEEAHVGLFDAALGVRARTTALMDFRQGPSKGMASVMRAVQQVLTDEPGPVLAVGISVPGPVDRATGLLINPPSMPGWEGFDVREPLARIMQARAFVNNDSNTFALGELWSGRRARGPGTAEHWLVVKMSSTGIGAGIILDGALYPVPRRPRRSG